MPTADPASLASLQRLLSEKRFDNPVWRRNRPRGWAGAWDTLYPGIFVAAVALVAVPIGAAGSPGPAPLLVVVFGGTLLQCGAGIALVCFRDFLAGRRQLLEELALTNLSYEEIAYGSYSAAVDGAVWVFLLAQMGEIIGALVVKPEFGFFVMFAMPPVRWAIFGRVLFLALDRRSRFQAFDVMFLIRTLIVYLTAATVCCVLVGVLVAIIAGVLSFLEPLRVVAVLGVALAYWIGGLRMGGRFDREWLPTAAGNLRRILER